MERVRRAGGRLGSPNAVAALAIAVALTVLCACVALLVYAQTAVDQISLARETRLMQVAMASQLSGMKEDVVANGTWTEAYLRTADHPDPDWFQQNLGGYLYPVRNHHMTLVLDGRDRPVFVSIRGKLAANADGATFIAAAGPLLAQVRAQSAEIAARHPLATGLERQASRAAMVRMGGEVYVTAAATIVPETSYGPPRSGLAPAILLSARRVDSRLLAKVGDQFGLAKPRLVLGAPPSASVPLRDASGQVVAALAWRPELSGRSVLLRARWQILGAALAMLAGVALLVAWLRRLAAEWLEARDRAEAGDRAKSEFIANMSHEIRTPLNGVLGMAQVMQAGELSPGQRERLAVIRDSGASLLCILNDVLDFSKIEAGKLTLSEAPFDAEELARRVCATFEAMAAAKDVELVLDVAEGARGGWIGDALRIRQMLSNLVSNAVKFTADGAVTVAVTTSGAGLVLSVTDTGIGLAADKIPDLFEKFSQVDPTVTRRHGGTGLGLSITRGLAQLMGGSVGVSSRAGQGSCFTLALPLARAPAWTVATAEPGPAAPAAPVAARTPRVLAAEDNVTNQYVLRAILEPLDVELTLVADGRQAVEACRAGAFDVILMDVQMPELNGVDATRAIRAAEAAAGARHTPIIAMTANVMSHQVESYLAAGMDGHIAKPVDVGAVYAALERALSTAQADAAAA